MRATSRAPRCSGPGAWADAAAHPGSQPASPTVPSRFAHAVRGVCQFRGHRPPSGFHASEEPNTLCVGSRPGRTGAQVQLQPRAPCKQVRSSVSLATKPPWRSPAPRLACSSCRPPAASSHSQESSFLPSAHPGPASTWFSFVLSEEEGSPAASPPERLQTAAGPRAPCHAARQVLQTRFGLSIY